MTERRVGEIKFLSGAIPRDRGLFASPDSSFESKKDTKQINGFFGRKTKENGEKCDWDAEINDNFNVSRTGDKNDGRKTHYLN